MSTIIEGMNFILHLLKFFRKNDRNVLMDSIRDHYNLAISDEGKKELAIANEWSAWQRYYPTLKKNPDIEPKDLAIAKEKYAIAIHWIIELSNARYIKKDKNGAVHLIPISHSRTFLNAGICLVGAGGCMAIGLYPVMTHPDYSQVFVYSYLTLICGAVTFILALGLNQLSTNLNCHNYYKRAHQGQ